MYTIIIGFIVITHWEKKSDYLSKLNNNVKMRDKLQKANSCLRGNFSIIIVFLIFVP